MPLVSGARLGSYEVIALLGSGGMGEVYRARDTRLRREVALKILPSEVVGDLDRRLRFEQEARAASALSHPNIVSIHDIGDAGSTLYIAMELLEGRSLRETLNTISFTPKKLLDVAVQIADGLANAHAAGIVHRDLKPENLMVSSEGIVKILDFGVAKLTAPLAKDSSENTTFEKPVTHAGVILGTVSYMSPEQVRGEGVDFRSDQFSVGSILYEMASGRRAFQKPTVAETMTAILREEPAPLSELNPNLPMPLRWIVERCLHKDPGERYASTRDLLVELRNLRDHLSEMPPSSAALALPAPRSRAWIAAGALTVLLLAILAGFGLGRRTGHPPSSDASSFRKLTFQRGTIGSARFAPDGTTVVYGASWEDRASQIFATRIDSLASTPLGLPAGDILSISASGELAVSLGRRIVTGWETEGTLARVPLGGGVPRELLQGVHEADWAPDGERLVIVRDAGAKRRLEFPMGNVLYETPGYISSVRFSPDGEHIAFFDHPSRGDNTGTVAVVDLGGEMRRLTEKWNALWSLAWSPTGDEIWFSVSVTGHDQKLRAVNLAGRGRLVLATPGAMILHDVSRQGRALLARRTFRREIHGLVPGAARETSHSWLDWSYPTDLSSDGRTLLFDEQGEGVEEANVTYLRRTDGSPAVRIGLGRSHALSPDGKWAATDAPEGYLVLLPTGVGEPRRLESTAVLTIDWAGWFPDGDRILLAGSEREAGTRLYIVEIASGSIRPLTSEGVSILNWSAISPDGALVVARGADRKFYLYPADGGEARPIPDLSSEDRIIRWTADGRGLYVFQSSSGASAMVDVVDVATGRRTPWKEIRPLDIAGVSALWPIHMTPDGRSYTYSYRRLLDELFVVEGLR